jgi:hypothetical protein
MDACVRAGRGAGSTAPPTAPPGLGAQPGPAAPPLVAAPVSGTAPVSPGGRRALTWALRGSAAALLASSALFGVLAWDAKRDFDGTTFERPATQANDRYALDATLAWSFAASGLACVLASYLIGR